MKLKQIVSLVLAGVLAVSMLAGCKAPAGNDIADESVVVSGAAQGVSSKVQDLLDKKDLITLMDNETYRNYLSAAIEKADLDSTNLTNYDLSMYLDNKVVKEILSKFDNNVVNSYKGGLYGWIVDLMKASSNPSAQSQILKAFYGEDGVYPFVFVLDGKASQDVAVNEMADVLNKLLTEDVLLDKVQNGNEIYNCKYSGSVSVQKVTDGSVSAWYFLFVLNVNSTTTETSDL